MICEECGKKIDELKYAVEAVQVAKKGQSVTYISKDGTRIHKDFYYFCSNECVLEKFPDIKTFKDVEKELLEKDNA